MRLRPRRRTPCPAWHACLAGVPHLFMQKWAALKAHLQGDAALAPFRNATLRLSLHVSGCAAVVGLSCRATGMGEARRFRV